MASSPETAPSGGNNGNSTEQSPPAASSPPPQSPPASTPPSSPPPASSSPPPAASSPPPTEEPPSPPPPSTTPTVQSPPPSDSASPPPPTTQSPPTARSPPAHGSPPAPVFSPPPQDSGSSQSPPSLSTAPPRSTSANRSPGSSPSTPNASSPSPPSSSDSNTNVAIVAGVIVGGVLIFAFIIICLVCVWRKKKRQHYMDHGHSPKDGNQYYNGPKDHVIKLPPPPRVNGTPVGSWGAPPPPPPTNNSSDLSTSYSGAPHTPLPPPSPNMGGMGSKSQFTYEELSAATGGFSQNNLLGQGGFGFVHKGVLPNGREVAVKSLKSGSGQGEREFQAEVEIISRVHHRHLVSLVGYCIADQQRMLVYEFVPNKTLEFHLHGKGQPVMDWSSRLRIAVGSAKGLAYLHEDCHPRIIHRDIKAANILIDYNFEAMVADFGLAKLTSDNFTHVSTRVMGTFGYLAPEYAASGKLTEKSDVFSFGVMLLELITGRKPVDPTNKTMEDSLVDWARPLMSKALEDGDYSKLVDPRLEDNYAAHEMARVIACAAAGIRHSARRRPRMSQIVRTLEGASSLEDLDEGVKPGQSAAYNPNNNREVYDTGAYNADMMKFKKMVMTSQDSSEYGATSEYGLNPSSSSSDSREMGSMISQEKQKG
ncbi:hypothetical protein BUALT_Bualt04G0074300 [Buddleja alternifolia]|uniref:non-specific serine/threonine protein kinase n=1 Tax=Buddleja alternifolia TaxID=168488 RepID=A0AAV6XTR8_9LAMI|nr:hypothetical protein BUALT_Bualt04G0074300 [Buddleja alternifolia]